MTDPASGSLWYVGGSYPSGSGTNELDQFANESWNANVTTSPVLGQFSSGTAQMIGSKIYLFGGLGSTGGQRSYQSFQTIPYIDISTNPPTTGVQVSKQSLSGKEKRINALDSAWFAETDSTGNYLVSPFFCTLLADSRVTSNVSSGPL